MNKYFITKFLAIIKLTVFLKTGIDKVNLVSTPGRLKTRDWKTRDWKTRHQTAGVENAGLENVAPDCRGGKRGSSTVWKAEVSVI